MSNSAEKKVFLREPSEGTLFVEATAVTNDNDNAPYTTTAVNDAIAVDDAIAVPPYNPHPNRDEEERYAAEIATRRGREAASAEIAAIRAHNNGYRFMEFDATGATYKNESQIFYNRKKDDTNLRKEEQSQEKTALATASSFGSKGGYQVQDYDTKSYDVNEYETKEYKSVYDE